MVSTTTAAREGRIEIARVRADAPEAVRLVRTYFADVAGRYYGRRATEAELDIAMAEDPNDALLPPRGAFLLARQDGLPAGCVGCAGLVPLGHGMVELKRMFVVPSVRGRGLGARLLAAAEDVAAELGATVIRLDTRHDLVEAQGLYRTRGFAEIPAYSEGPYAEVFFEKRL
ncbi:GNAT family N-acetyltransferase [Saccharomonospora piscinae]|uniref:GNAT family N-acetyltransferase n=1 Tax=Saccharomonospora piscinae TaxID=687388 RepID=UPI0026CD8707